MNGSLSSNEGLLAAARADGERAADVDLALCVPFPYLAQARDRLAGARVALGAQDVSLQGAGAYTGEVSAAMLVDLGCGFVIVGHSERRAMHGETDEQVGRKAAVALSAGLSPIICVGETLVERDAGDTRRIVLRQVGAVAGSIGAADWSHAVIAYEPVWAIGTGRTASAEQANEVHRAIRDELSRLGADAAAVRIIYGGSVKPGNAAELFSMTDIDGGLIGGAALVAADFSAICDAAQGTC
jgi:triosephosphate isomerase